MTYDPTTIFSPAPSYNPGGSHRRGMWRVDYYKRNGCVVSQWFRSKQAAQDRFTVLYLKGKEPELWKESKA